jgi:hypothetical protein
MWVGEGKGVSLSDLGWLVYEVMKASPVAKKRIIILVRSPSLSLSFSRAPHTRVGWVDVAVGLQLNCGMLFIFVVVKELS